jgi:hypothetical protein
MVVQNPLNQRKKPFFPNTTKQKCAAQQDPSNLRRQRACLPNIVKDGINRDAAMAVVV